MNTSFTVMNAFGRRVTTAGACLTRGESRARDDDRARVRPRASRACTLARDIARGVDV